MTDDDEHLAVEVAQFLQHVHDITDLLAERMGNLPEAEYDQPISFRTASGSGTLFSCR